MGDLVQRLIDSGAAPGGVPAWVHYLTAALVFGGIVVFGFVLPIAGITTWVERRIMGRMQSRIGPNRVGPAGFLQWLADGIKNMLKEDIIPTAADRWLFSLAPYLVVIGFVATFASSPMSIVPHGVHTLGSRLSQSARNAKRLVLFGPRCLRSVTDTSLIAPSLGR